MSSVFLSSSTYRWLIQRFSGIFLLFLFPWFIYLFFSPFYFGVDLSFNEKLLKSINNPLEFLFFIILLFFVFWHSVIGIQVLCEDYIHNVLLRIFVIKFIKFFSSITYIILIFTIFLFYKNVFF